MSLLSFKEKIQVPFIGVKWNLETGKIVSHTDAWTMLPQDVQWEALAMADWDFLTFNDARYFKYIVPSEKDNYQTFYLLPADEWYNHIQKIEKLEKELTHTREQLLGFVQNVPIPLLVISEDNQKKVTFANHLLLNFFDLPLSSLYKGLTLEDFFHNQTPKILDLFNQSRETGQAVQEIVQIENKNLNEFQSRFLLLRVFPFKTSFMNGHILGILDLTKEKQQEYELQEAYNEMQVQAESLAEAYDALSELHEELRAKHEIIENQKKELEQSLHAARRFEKKILLNEHHFLALKPFYQVKMHVKTYSAVGGDFLLFVSENLFLEDWHFVVLGDATGHGASGAMLALTFSMLLRNCLSKLKNLDQLHEVLSEVHNQILEILDARNQIVSPEGAEVALLALPKNPKVNPEFYFSLAGRPLYFFDSNTQQIQIYQHRNHSLGFYVQNTPEPSFITEKIKIQPQDIIFLFSDGFTDQLNPEGKKISKKRAYQWLKETINFNKLDDKFQHLYLQWNNWKQNSPQTDDVILLTIQNVVE
jgi:serine phosphatase RsbU (regulator of sigma subunit)